MISPKSPIEPLSIARSHLVRVVRGSWAIAHSLTQTSIRRRLAVGYILTIGLCATGIQAGRVISNRQIEEPARKRLDTAYLRLARFSELQESFIDNDRMLLTYINRPELVSDYGYHLSNNAKQLQSLLEAIAADASTLGEADRTYTQVSVGLSQSEINLFIRKCAKVGTQYDAKLTQLLDRVSGSPSQTARGVQSELIGILSDYTAVELETCSLQLKTIIVDTQNDLTKASNALAAARKLEIRITYGSLILSMLGAIAIALFNSWAITRPLTQVSQVAQRVSKEEDFSLQVPVTAEDEVGLVARSFNELIAKVKQLLKEQQANQKKLEYYNQALAFTNQTLEATVEERTQDLNRQNASLQETVQALQETRSQLFQAEKMSSLGQLVAGIAHEINNPVNFIHGNLTYAEEYLQDLVAAVELYDHHCELPVEVQGELAEIDLDFVQADALKLLKSMRMGTERIRQIVLSLRNFSRLDEAERKTADIHEGIDSTLLILGHRLKGNEHRDAIAIQKQYDLDRRVECFPGLLNQVLMNILSNAIDALDEQAQVSSDKTFELAISTVEAADNFIQIRIADNGSGIPESVKAKIFEPFFTTKEVGKGTGMGLSISYKIITERHQGKLTCESALDKGTTFIIELPV